MFLLIFIQTYNLQSLCSSPPPTYLGQRLWHKENFFERQIYCLEMSFEMRSLSCAIDRPGEGVGTKTDRREMVGLIMAV